MNNYKSDQGNYSLLIFFLFVFILAKNELLDPTPGWPMYFHRKLLPSLGREQVEEVITRLEGVVASV